jgi:hypothetical protein
VWHIIQTRIENKGYEEEIKQYGSAESLKKLIGQEDPHNP